MRNLSLFVTPFLIPLALVLVGCFEQPTPRQNMTTVINGFQVNGERVDDITAREGEQLTITMVAWDPNGDAIGADKIAWTATSAQLPDAQGGISGSGPSIRYTVPAVSWGQFGQSVDVTVMLTVTIQDGDQTVTRTLPLLVMPPCPPDNQPPVINEIIAAPGEITLGDTTRVQVDAFDPDGNGDPSTLTYKWTPAFGNIHGKGSEVDWETTDVCCTDYYDIQVVVSDGCDSSWKFTEVFIRI